MVTLPRADQSRPEQTRADQSRPEQTRADQSRPEQTRADQSRPEQQGESRSALILVPTGATPAPVREHPGLEDGAERGSHSLSALQDSQPQRSDLRPWCAHVRPYAACRALKITTVSARAMTRSPTNIQHVSARNLPANRWIGRYWLR